VQGVSQWQQDIRQGWRWLEGEPTIWLSGKKTFGDFVQSVHTQTGTAHSNSRDLLYSGGTFFVSLHEIL
jgi:hypothetical protein